MKLLKTLQAEKEQVEKVVTETKGYCTQELFEMLSSTGVTTDRMLGRMEMAQSVIEFIDKSMGAIGKQ